MTTMPSPGAHSVTPQPAPLVVTDFPFDEPDRTRLAGALRPGALVAVSGRNALPEALTQHPAADVLCTFSPPRDLLSLAPGIRWVQLASAGADAAVQTGLLDLPNGPAVTTSSGIHAIPMAEYALSSMLLWVRHWPRMLELQRAATWADRPTWLGLRGGELHGATLGIVGLGHIGRQVARLGHAFGMRPLGLRRSSASGERDPDVDQLYAPDALNDLLAASDFVLVAVPITPATHHLIAEPQLRAMRPTAYLVNIARGDVMDEQALIRALREGWLAGAGLDVTEREPLDSSSPLWTMPNVILSPHVSGATDRYSARLTDLFLDNLNRYRTGQPLLNLVDPARGY